MPTAHTETIRLNPVRTGTSASGSASGGTLSAAARSALEEIASGFYKSEARLPLTRTPDFPTTEFTNAASQRIKSANSAKDVAEALITVEAQAAGLGKVFKNHLNLAKLLHEANMEYVKNSKEETLARIAAGAEIARTAMAAAHEIQVQEASQRVLLELAAEEAALGRIR
jgi:hypothetical protein